MIIENISLRNALPKSSEQYFQNSPDAPADVEGNFLHFSLSSFLNKNNRSMLYIWGVARDYLS